ncbi:DUF4838 domain-containing protein [Chitinophaga sp.]|uniref:DUF4838 domain-containing protein n=1 Tax=Chitinophaga sp. TaxID=1869181 RepID=UPI0031DF9D7F
MTRTHQYVRIGILIAVIAAIIPAFAKRLPATAQPVNDQPAVTLVNNGKSNYAVVIPATPAAQEQRAATLLQRYIEKMSGCRLPVVTALAPGQKGVFIRETGGLLYDGYRINTRPDGSLHIEGGKSRGCIYGAVQLLDKYFGCRLYSPRYKVIPASKTLRLPDVHEADSSVNNLRIVFTMNEFSKDEDLLDWHRTTNRFPPFADDYYCHTFTHRLVPPDVFYASHPEYFAEIGGQRIRDQLCMSNPDVVQEVIKQLKKDIPLQPDRLYWSVSQADGPLYCQCALCKKAIEEEKSVAGPIIRFVNQVAAEFPDKIISTLAYYYSLVPPAVTKPLDNVQIMYCGGDLAAWGKIAKHIYVWDYVVNYFHYQSPYPSLFLAQPQVQDQVSKGANEFFIQGNIDYGMEFAELRLYLYSRIAWNPNVDVSATINEFLKGYYGPAAPHIRQYIDLISTAYEKTKAVKPLIINTPPSYYQDTYLSPENLKAYNLAFDAAEAAVKGNSVFARHVHLARMPLNFAEMEIAKHNMYGPAGWWNKAGTVRNKRLDGLLNDFYNTLQREGITDINENHYRLEDYKKHTLFSTSNKAATGNLAFRQKVSADIMPREKQHRFYSADLGMLTDGARGDDATRNLFWLIWPDKEFTLTVDLGAVKKISSIDMGTLWRDGPTIPPASVQCSVSRFADKDFSPIGTQTWQNGQEKKGEADWRYVYSFKTDTEARYIQLKITRHDLAFSGRKAGMPVSTYIDEIEVR